MLAERSHLRIFPRSTLSSTLRRFSSAGPDAADFLAVMKPVLDEVSPGRDYLESYEEFQRTISDPEVSDLEVENLRARVAAFLCVYRALRSVNRAAITNIQMLIELAEDSGWATPAAPTPASGGDSSEGDSPGTAPWDGENLCQTFNRLTRINVLAVRDIFVAYRYLAGCATADDDLREQTLPTPISIPPVVDGCPEEFLTFSPEVQTVAAAEDPDLWRAFPARAYIRYLSHQPDVELRRMLDFHLSLRDEEAVIRLFCRDIAAALDEALADRAGVSSTQGPPSSAVAFAAAALHHTTTVLRSGSSVEQPLVGRSRANSEAGRAPRGRIRWAQPLVRTMYY